MVPGWTPTSSRSVKEARTWRGSDGSGHRPDSSFQPGRPPGSGLFTWSGSRRAGPRQPVQAAGAEFGRTADRTDATPGSPATFPGTGWNEYAARSAPYEATNWGSAASVRLAAAALASTAPPVMLTSAAIASQARHQRRARAATMSLIMPPVLPGSLGPP